MNEENRLIIDQLNKFGRVPETYELLKKIEDLEQENQELKSKLELYKGGLHREHEAIHRANDLEEENQKYKEVIDKAIKYIEKDYSYTKRHDIPLLTKDEQLAGKLLDILKEVE